MIEAHTLTVRERGAILMAVGREMLRLDCTPSEAARSPDLAHMLSDPVWLVQPPLISAERVREIMEGRELWIEELHDLLEG